MPEGVGYAVHRSGAPPSAGMVRDAGKAGVLWQQPGGAVYWVRPDGMFDASEEQKAYANQPAPATATDQLGALEGAPAAPAAPAAKDLGGGVTVGETRTVVPRNETLTQKNEREKREAAAGAVAVAGGQARAAQEGTMGGLSLGDRSAVQELVNSGMTEEEAVEKIRSMRAEEQLNALEAAPAP